jgi:glycerol-3-phosphate dehydrogenase
MIIDKICEIMQTETDKEIAIVKGELWYCIKYELCNTLSDFFVRRTGRLYFRRKTIEKLIAPITEELQKYFQLSPQELQKMQQHFKQEYEEVVTFL